MDRVHGNGAIVSLNGNSSKNVFVEKITNFHSLCKQFKYNYSPNQIPGPYTCSTLELLSVTSTYIIQMLVNFEIVDLVGINFDDFAIRFIY